jgi:hypothetical protein
VQSLGTLSYAGSGSNTLGNTGNNVFLDEYTTAGSLVQSFEPQHRHLMAKIPGIDAMRSKFK